MAPHRSPHRRPSGTPSDAVGLFRWSSLSCPFLPPEGSSGTPCEAPDHWSSPGSLRRSYRPSAIPVSWFSLPGTGSPVDPLPGTPQESSQGLSCPLTALTPQMCPEVLSEDSQELLKGDMASPCRGRPSGCSRGLTGSSPGASGMSCGSSTRASSRCPAGACGTPLVFGSRIREGIHEERLRGFPPVGSCSVPAVNQRASGGRYHGDQNGPP